jgi:uracil-DNA glycosylase family 4
MTTFSTYTSCDRCPLCKNAKHIGMATYQYTNGASPDRKTKALLVVGEAPGREEDEAGRPFIGISGKYLSNLYLDLLRLWEHADIYLTNACRCHPPLNNTPTKGQITKCQPHLISDIQAIQADYEELVILCVGASGVQAILSTSLSRSFVRQGQYQTWGWAGTEGLRPCRVFTTYHPALLLPTREPSKVSAVGDHIRLLAAYLKGDRALYPTLPPVRWAPPPPSHIDRLSLDIETYGAVADEPPQTSFHPAKCQALDCPGSLIKTVAVAYRTAEGIQTAVFQWKNQTHRSTLRKYIRATRELVGMNLKFDILFLRTDPQFATLLHPRSGLHLTDLSILNYLHSEQRPERSLKSLSPLLGITEYDETKSLRHHRYPTGEDPELAAYNVKDAWATLLAVEDLEAKLGQIPDSEKWSSESREWYSRLLWTVLLMEESGVAFDGDRLIELDFAMTLKMALLYSECRHKHTLILANKGSEKSQRALFMTAIEESHLVGDPRIERTPKRQDIAINQKNANLLLQHLDPSSHTTFLLRKHLEYGFLQKLVTSYTRPMLYGTPKNPSSSRLVALSRVEVRNGRGSVAMAYPSWYAVPSLFDSGVEGGTIQARITSKGPALQTLPKEIKKCLTSRFNPGFLIGVDLSQIELRIAALLSGDELMLQEYADDIDRHTQTALRLIGAILEYLDQTGQDTIELGGRTFTRSHLNSHTISANPRDDKTFNILRQAGKTQNFLNIYGGSAFKLQGTLAADLGISLPVEVCDRLIQVDRQRYRTLAVWQRALIERVKVENRYELPITGQSRMFLGSPAVVEATYASEILNFPIQATAANVMLDLQAALTRELLGRRRRTFLGLNIYDAIYLDGPISEMGVVLGLVRKTFRHSEYLEKLQDRLGRTVPLKYDVGVLVEDPIPGLTVKVA